MVGVIRRLRALKTLYSIRLGPGAAILPKDVRRVHMDFAYKFNDGHLGARKFWQTYLPRLKFHNPVVSMTINRNHEQSGAATMTVFFGPSLDPSAPTGASVQDTSVNERAEVIDMKHKREEDILKKFMDVTKATEIKATEEDLAEKREIEEAATRSEQDKVRVLLDLQKKRRDVELLAKAKASVASLL